MINRSHFLKLWMVLTVGLSFLAACESDHLTGGMDDNPKESQSLNLQLVAQAGSAMNASAAWNRKEVDIRELFIYAFDDVHKRPDFYWDVFTGDVSIKNYSVQMEINGLGTKRFYVIANPPQYIKKELTFDCNEGKLKSMTMELQHPLEDILKLPQESDGISNPGGIGFPMANQFTAFVKKGKLKGDLQLTADENSNKSITRIPVYRSLGKVSVSVRKKEVEQSDVSVKTLQIFNYTCNGRFMPLWNPSSENWTSNGEWNPKNELDLASLVREETKVGVAPVSLLKKAVLVDSTSPLPLTAFYLCQNSFGEKLKDETQTGISDVNGNRTTKMAVELSDGRQSIVEFPYLRRNDHLQVRIVITKNKIEFSFLPWNTSEVTPDWDEEIKPKK